MITTASRVHTDKEREFKGILEAADYELSAYYYACADSLMSDVVSIETDIVKSEFVDVEKHLQTKIVTEVENSPTSCSVFS